MVNEARCDDQSLAEVRTMMRQRDRSALPAVDRLLETFPNDARLNLLRGSLLADDERFAEAVREFECAVENDPELEIARFQLGLLHATLGHTDRAFEVWSVFRSVQRDSALAMFAYGLELLLRGKLADSKRCLRAGIALNDAAPVLSVDMEKIVERIELRPRSSISDGVDERSQGHLLISEYLLGRYSSH